MVASNEYDTNQHTAKRSYPISFAGDHVRLAGQIDYPAQPAPVSGYPLIFVIQHATSTSRDSYQYVVRIGAESNMAVFRWDKRGTGKSASGGNGSVMVDAIHAYQTALSQADIDRNQIIILAQLEGTLLLNEAFDDFRAIQAPRGVILTGNMLDEKAILTLDVPVHILLSKNDWNDWHIYAESAAKSHATHYGISPSYYVAPNTDRKLKYTNTSTFHRGAEDSIKDWLKQLCQIS